MRKEEELVFVLPPLFYCSLVRSIRLYSAVDCPDSLYVVKSASGGKVTPEESTLTAQSPVLILEPNRADYRPIFDGKPLKATNGVYRVTVSEAGEHTVEWEEISVDKPQIYTVDGVRSAFLSDDSARFEWNESEYVPYTSLTEAVAALGTDGGNIIVNGTYTHTTFSDTQNRKTVTFFGTGTDSVIALTSDSGPLTLNHGAAAFDDIRVSVEGVGKYIHGNGNLFVYVNKGAVYNVTVNSLSTTSGCRTVIFNNGLGTLSSMNEVPVSSQYQFIVRSEIGGTVSVENENTTENPLLFCSRLTEKFPL